MKQKKNRFREYIQIGSRPTYSKVILRSGDGRDDEVEEPW